MVEMGLNDIQLTASSLVELYAASLVDTGDIPRGLPPIASSIQAEPETNAGAGFQGMPANAGQESPVSLQPAPMPVGVAVEPVPETINPEVNSVVPVPPSIPAATPAAPAWRSLGNNRKKILIVVDYAGTAYLPDDELAFLTKMLEACKLSLDDVAIVNRTHYPEAASAAYLKHFGSRIVFLFGPDPASFGLPLSFPPYQVQAFAGTTFLHTPPLEERMRDDLFKSKLWVSLKRIFSL